MRSGCGAQGHGAADLQLLAAAHAYLPCELDGLLLDLLLDVCPGTARGGLEARGHPRPVLPGALAQTHAVKASRIGLIFYCELE